MLTDERLNTEYQQEKLGEAWNNIERAGWQAIAEIIEDVVKKNAPPALEAYAVQFWGEATAKGAEFGIQFEVGTLHTRSGNPVPFTLYAADLVRHLRWAVQWESGIANLCDDAQGCVTEAEALAIAQAAQDKHAEKTGEQVRAVSARLDLDDDMD